MKRLSVAALLLVILFAGSATAWNSRGHMMVAAIAWDHLDENAKARAVELLKLNPEYQNWIKDRDPGERDEVAFVMAATWPDFIKSADGYINDGEDPTNSAKAPKPDQNIGYADMFQHRYWHYIDMPFSQDGTALIDPKVPNAKTRIEKFRAALSSDANDDIKSYGLVWLLHLVGDVHQPLHATSRFSAASPKGDNGGNDVKLCEKPCRSNLHSFWDDVLGTSTSPTAAIKAAGKLDEADSDAAAVTDAQAWVDESFALAEKFVYRPPVGADNGPFTLTTSYKKKVRSIAEDQVALAGARLGKLLNDSLH